MSNSHSPLPPACADACEQLSAYLDGELPEDERAQLEAHLGECPACAALCDGLRTLRAELAAAALDPPDGLSDRILARVRREKRLRRLRRLTAFGAAGAAACICFVFTGIALRHSAQENSLPDLAPAMLAAAPNGAADGTGAASTYDFGSFSDMLDANFVVAGTGIESTAPCAGTEAKSTTTEPLPEPVERSVGIAANAVGEDSAPPAVMPEGIYSAHLPENLRSLAQLSSSSRLTTFAETTTAQANAAPSLGEEDAKNKLTCTEEHTFSLSSLAEDPDALLAVEQVGVLCTVEIKETRTFYVFDLITGDYLSLQDFVGEETMPALVDAAHSLCGVELTLASDCGFYPTAAGLVLLLDDGALTLPWDADPAISACIERYAMTEPPLCAPEGCELVP